MNYEKIILRGTVTHELGYAAIFLRRPGARSGLWRALGLCDVAARTQALTLMPDPSRPGAAVRHRDSGFRVARLAGLQPSSIGVCRGRTPPSQTTIARPPRW